MAKRKIIALLNLPEWGTFLTEAFKNTPSKPEIISEPEKGLQKIRRESPDVVFIQTKFLTKPLIAALQTHRTSSPHFRAFHIEENKNPSLYPFDGFFSRDLPALFNFQKTLAESVPLPDPLRILVVDDEPNVREVFQDYFDKRTSPAYIVDLAENGREGEAKILKSPPHILVLDIRMPVKNGRDVYRDLRKRGVDIPTIIFSAFASSEDVIEIKKHGNPVFIEKASQAGSMPALAALIKNLVHFG